MSEFTALADYRSWTILWDHRSGKLYLKKHGSITTHDFYERPRDRVTAIAIAKEWIDRR